MAKTVVVTKKCKICRENKTVVLSEKAYKLWEMGYHIQDVAPELSIDDREFLISGICGPCYDGLFREDEEYEGMD